MNRLTVKRQYFKGIGTWGIFAGQVFVAYAHSLKRAREAKAFLESEMKGWIPPVLENSLARSCHMRRKEGNIIKTVTLDPHPNPFPKGEGVFQQPAKPETRLVTRQLKRPLKRPLTQALRRPLTQADFDERPPNQPPQGLFRGIVWRASLARRAELGY
jgi:hypothetical protein